MPSTTTTATPRLHSDECDGYESKFGPLASRSNYYIRIAKSIRAKYYRSGTHFTSDDFHQLHDEACESVLRSSRDRTDLAIDAENDVMSQSGWIAEMLFGIDQIDDMWYDAYTFSASAMTAILDVMIGDAEVCVHDWRVVKGRGEIKIEREKRERAEVDASPAPTGSITFGGDWDNDDPVVRRECCICLRWKPLDEVEKRTCECSRPGPYGSKCSQRADACITCVEQLSRLGFDAVRSIWHMPRDTFYAARDASRKADAAPLAADAPEQMVCVEKVGSRRVRHIVDVPDGLIDFRYDDGGRVESGRRGSTGDCVVRALSILTGHGYSDVYAKVADANKRLSRTQGRTARNGVETKITESVMAEFGMSKARIPGGRARTISEIGRHLGDCIIRFPGHVAAIVDGELRDTWDSRIDRMERVDGDVIPHQRRVHQVYVLDGSALPDGYVEIPLRERTRRIGPQRFRIAISDTEREMLRDVLDFAPSDEYLEHRIRQHGNEYFAGVIQPLDVRVSRRPKSISPSWTGTLSGTASELGFLSNIMVDWIEIAGPQLGDEFVFAAKVLRRRIANRIEPKSPSKPRRRRRRSRVQIDAAPSDRYNRIVKEIGDAAPEPSTSTDDESAVQMGERHADALLRRFEELGAMHLTLSRDERSAVILTGSRAKRRGHRMLAEWIENWIPRDYADNPDFGPAIQQMVGEEPYPERLGTWNTATRSVMIMTPNEWKSIRTMLARWIVAELDQMHLWSDSECEDMDHCIRIVARIDGMLDEPTPPALDASSGPASTPRCYYLHLDAEERERLRAVALQAQEMHLPERDGMCWRDALSPIDNIDGSGIEGTQSEWHAIHALLELHCNTLPHPEAQTLAYNVHVQKPQHLVDTERSLLDRVRQFRDDVDRAEGDCDAGEMLASGAPVCTACVYHGEDASESQIDGLAGLCLEPACPNYAAICVDCVDEYPTILHAVQQGYCAEHMDRATEMLASDGPVNIPIPLDTLYPIPLTDAQWKRLLYISRHARDLEWPEYIDIFVSAESYQHEESGVRLWNATCTQAEIGKIVALVQRHIDERCEGEYYIVEKNVLAKMHAVLDAVEEYKLRASVDMDAYIGADEPILDSDGEIRDGHCEHDLYWDGMHLDLEPDHWRVCRTLLADTGPAAHLRDQIGINIWPATERFRPSGRATLDIQKEVMQELREIVAGRITELEAQTHFPDELSTGNTEYTLRRTRRLLDQIDREFARDRKAYELRVQTETPEADEELVDEQEALDASDGMDGVALRDVGRVGRIELSKPQSKRFDITQQLIDDAQSPRPRRYSKCLDGMTLDALTFEWNAATRVIVADEDALELLIEVQDRRLHEMRDCVGFGGGNALRSERAIRGKMIAELDLLRDAPWRKRPRTAYAFDDMDQLRQEVKVLAALADTIQYGNAGLRLRNAVMIALEDALPGHYRKRMWKVQVDYYTDLVERTCRSRTMDTGIRMLVQDRIDVLRAHDAASERDADGAEMLASDGPSDAPTLADYLGDRKCLACGAQIEPTDHARRRFCSRRCAGRYGYHHRKNQRQKSESRDSE